MFVPGAATTAVAGARLFEGILAASALAAVSMSTRRCFTTLK